LEERIAPTSMRTESSYSAWEGVACEMGGREAVMLITYACRGLMCQKIDRLLDSRSEILWTMMIRRVVPSDWGCFGETCGPRA